MSCDDPDCPGCITEAYVNAMKAVGCDSEVIFHAVMAELNSNPEDGFDVTILEGTVH
jgi:hypothetical protein